MSLQVREVLLRTVLVLYYTTDCTFLLSVSQQTQFREKAWKRSLSFSSYAPRGHQRKRSSSTVPSGGVRERGREKN